ncbi:hypothetical protein EVAR_54456_1 [Eumeta japonica]|uniref:Uncharacterized protein n=1 Tax=Eumeta variegata TaxID=151549 RepID=A0A4C1XIA7_EUMVA|nr:hypothetical protein EVAR_54456_1 [Eumeta japonica]
MPMRGRLKGAAGGDKPPTRARPRRPRASATAPVSFRAGLRRCRCYLLHKSAISYVTSAHMRPGGAPLSDLPYGLIRDS